MRTVFWCSLAASATMVVGGVIGWHAWHHPAACRGRAAVAGAARLAAGGITLPGLPVRPGVLFTACHDTACAEAARAVCPPAAEEVCEAPAGVPAPPAAAPAPTPPVTPLPEVIDLSQAPELLAPPHMPQSDEPPLAPEVVPVEHAAEPAEMPAGPRIIIGAEEEIRQTGVGEIPPGGGQVRLMPHLTDECPLCAKVAEWTAKAKPALAWAAEQDRKWTATVRAAVGDFWSGKYAAKKSCHGVRPCSHAAPCCHVAPGVPDCRETPVMERYYPGCPYTGDLPHPVLKPASHEEASEEVGGERLPCHPDVDTMEYREEDRQETPDTPTGPY